jgi:hypothetical protein
MATEHGRLREIALESSKNLIKPATPYDAVKGVPEGVVSGEYTGVSPEPIGSTPPAMPAKKPYEVK